MACVGGGIDVYWLVLAAACCVRGLVSGRGRGGVVWGWCFWWWGGRGWVLCWLGVWASLWVVWVLRVCAVRPLRFLTGCGAGVWVGGGRMSVRVGLWSVCNGWLLVDGAGWYGVWVGGLLVVVRWGGLVWFGSRPVPDALAHGQHSPLCRHDWARRIAVVRSQGLPDC